ncbi:MAG TPA: secondary thiamine-phosphate synthase enzyme YjbQ [Gaiellaceae bacterium]|nr:secondary thiamine-phosphate synthase enzyme YjbQ [Gaiellaceae bacterium]
MIELAVSTTRRTELVDITALVATAVARTSGTLATVFVPHSTCGVVVQAAGPGATLVAGDVEDAFEGLVDETRPWRHAAEGEGNPWSHVRAALTASSVSIPLSDGTLALGAVQSVFLCEFDGPRGRRVLVVVT